MPVSVTLARAGFAFEARLVFGLHRVDDRFRRIALDAIRVAHHEEDADRQSGDEDHQPSDQPFADRDTGDAGRDAGRERVDRRAEYADPAAEQDDRGAR